MQQLVFPGAVSGRLIPPADKSISHRALLFAALAHGESRISNLLLADDVLATWRSLSALGVQIRSVGDSVTVFGRGAHFARPARPLFAGNSGTTMRLLTGLLAAQPLQVTLVGDRSLNRRPLERVLKPLRLMGVKAYATPTGTAPLLILGQPLHGISYRLPVASAQLKSALLLAALQASGESEIIDPVPSRDHSERMLADMGARIVRQDDRILIPGNQSLFARDFDVPGDFSSAAPFLTAALLSGTGSLQVARVGLNPTRTGLLSVFRRMGADMQETVTSSGLEPQGEILARGGKELEATTVSAEEIPLLIDEVPLLVVAACFARGTTVIHGVSELRVKESDRVESIVQPLCQLGAKIEVDGDSLYITGRSQPFSGGLTLPTAGDHRIAMALAVAATRADQPIRLDGAEWVSISYPEFFSELSRSQEVAKCAF